MPRKTKFTCDNAVTTKRCEGGECCTVVPFSKKFIEKFKHRFVRPVERFEPRGKDIYLITADGKCPFLNQNNKCVIYKDRPKQCRDFGNNGWCPYLNENGVFRSHYDEKYVKTILANAGERMYYTGG